MTNRLAELQSDYAGLEFVLPPGVIHGDASIGNVLRDRQGNPVVIDLDGFAIGPREWDVVLTAIYYDSFGWHTREEYETFARVYGFDIMTWPGYPVLREVREFLMVTWVIQKASENERTAAEARKRIAALRSGASRKDLAHELRPGHWSAEEDGLFDFIGGEGSWGLQAWCWTVHDGHRRAIPG